jgi:hypothetical protein
LKLGEAEPDPERELVFVDDQLQVRNAHLHLERAAHPADHLVDLLALEDRHRVHPRELLLEQILAEPAQQLEDDAVADVQAEVAQGAYDGLAPRVVVDVA